MRTKSNLRKNVILGDCSFFACRCCRTKYGWEHQEWCELSDLTDPTCLDCQYYRERGGACRHPARKEKCAEAPKPIFGTDPISKL